MLPVFKKIRVEDRDLQMVQDSAATVFNIINNKQILDGVLIEGVVLLNASNPTSVSHGLGKEPRGWIVVKKDANADVYSSASTTPKSTLNLNATADVTISLWVF